MNMIEYNQKMRRLDEDIKRYKALSETTRHKLIESIKEQMALYHEGWTE